MLQGDAAKNKFKKMQKLNRLFWFFGKQRHQQMKGAIEKLAMHDYLFKLILIYPAKPHKKDVGLHLCSEALGKPCHNKGAHAVT